LPLRSYTQRLRVAFIDTDLSGRIHYTAAMRYFEAAEHGLMREVYAEIGGEPRGNLPRVHVEADFREALGFDEEIDCRATVLKIGRTSITYGYEIRRPDGPLCITGRIVAVAIGPDERPTPLSEALCAALRRDA
jgi:acyl-CoA thioester hydrolase